MWSAVHNKKMWLGQKLYVKEYLSFGIAKSQLLIILFKQGVLGVAVV